VSQFGAHSRYAVFNHTKHCSIFAFPTIVGIYTVPLSRSDPSLIRFGYITGGAGVCVGVCVGVGVCDGVPVPLLDAVKVYVLEAVPVPELDGKGIEDGEHDTCCVVGVLVYLQISPYPKLLPSQGHTVDE
jgi:hypothetical protein